MNEWLRGNVAERARLLSKRALTVTRHRLSAWQGLSPVRLILNRWFPERQIVLRSGERVRFLMVPSWMQIGVLCGLVFVVVGVGGLAGAYHNLHKAIHRKEAVISEVSERAAALGNLRQDLATADEQYAEMSAQFDDLRQQLDMATADNDALRGSIDAAEARGVVLDKERLGLEQQLQDAELALSNKSGNLNQLSRQLTDNRATLHEAEIARGALQKKLQQLQADSQAADERTSDLKTALTSRERQLHDLATERDRLRAQLDRQIPAPATARGSSLQGYGTDLEHLIASTGVDLDKLLGSLGSVPAGQGGPFIALGSVKEQTSKQREEVLQSLAKSLPLAAPLAHYQLESGFGPRVDPIRHRAAFHSGLDLSAPYRTPVLSTAPGTVTFTGSESEYGRVVEITHAHGIVTRYAHLHRITVAPGEKVAAHQEIGELGSSGRTTGPHVHYEILVDGTAVDPAKFMNAGKGVEQIGGK